MQRKHICHVEKRRVVRLYGRLLKEMQYAERDTRYDDTYQFAVVVFAISAVLDVVCVRSLLLAQQARKLGTVAGKHANGIKRSDEKATHFKNLPEKSVFVRKWTQDLSFVRKLWRLLWVFSAMNNILVPQPKPVKPNA